MLSCDAMDCSLLGSSAQFSSVAQLCPTLRNPMNRSTPGLPVHHQLPEFTQTQVHRVSDAIQPSHPLSTLLLLPPIPPSIRVFSNESTLRMRWPLLGNPRLTARMTRATTQEAGLWQSPVQMCFQDQCPLGHPGQITVPLLIIS